MSFEHAQTEHQTLEKKAGEVVKSAAEFLEPSERAAVLKTYGEKTGKHLRQLKTIAESQDEELKKIGHESLKTFLTTLKDEHVKFVATHEKEGAGMRAADILEQAKNFNLFLEQKISLFEGHVEKVRPRTMERPATKIPEPLEKAPPEVREKEKPAESFVWLFTDIEERGKSYGRQLKSYQSMLKKEEAKAETALRELHALHESGGSKETLQFALRKIDDAAQSKKDVLDLVAQLSKQHQELFSQDVENLLRKAGDYVKEKPEQRKVFQDAFKKWGESQPDSVKPLLGMIMLKKQVEAREKSPQGTLLKVFSLVRAYLEQSRAVEKLSTLTALEKLLFEDPTIDSLEKLGENIPKGNEALAALIREINELSGNTLMSASDASRAPFRLEQFEKAMAKKIEEMREKNPDPLFRLQLIWDLMEGGERAREPRIQKFHQELVGFIQSGDAKDIGEAISKVNRPDDAMAWEQAFRRGRGESATINAGSPTSPRALGDLWSSDLTQSESRSYLIRKTAEVLLTRGNPEDRAKGRKMLSDFCHDVIEKEKIGTLSELASMNLDQEKKEVFEKSRVMAYQEQSTEKNRQKLSLEIANSMLADNIKEGLGDGQKISTLRSLLEEQGKNLDVILEQSIYVSSSAIAEKTAEEQVQKKFLAVALKYTDIEKLKSESGTSDKDQNQLEALRLLQQSTGAKGLSDETKEWVKWFGEEAVINAALLAVSAGVGNLARAGTKAGLKLGKTTLRQALKQGGRATLQWAGRESVLLGAESLAFHEMNALLQAGLHGDMSQWYGQSFKEHLKGWGHSYVTLGILKAGSAAYAKIAGEKLTGAAASRAKAGASEQAAFLGSLNYMGGLATETTAFQLSAMDREALSDPKAWVNSLMSVISLRMGGALPHTKAIHEATAAAIRPEKENPEQVGLPSHMREGSPDEVRQEKPQIKEAPHVQPDHSKHIIPETIKAKDTARFDNHNQGRTLGGEKVEDAILVSVGDPLRGGQKSMVAKAESDVANPQDGGNPGRQFPGESSGEGGSGRNRSDGEKAPDSKPEQRSEIPAPLKDYKPREEHEVLLKDIKEKCKEKKSDQEIHDIDQLLAKGAEVFPAFLQEFGSLAKEVGAEFKTGPLKERGRAQEKVDKYVDKFKNEGVRYLLDVVRGSFIFDSIDGVYRGLEKIRDKIDIVKIDPRIENGIKNGLYGDIMLNIKMNGIIIELQLHVKSVRQQSEPDHKLYDQRRLFERLEEKAREAGTSSIDHPILEKKIGDLLEGKLGKMEKRIKDMEMNGDSSEELQNEKNKYEKSHRDLYIESRQWIEKLKKEGREKISLAELKEHIDFLFGEQQKLYIPAWLKAIDPSGKEVSVNPKTGSQEPEKKGSVRSLETQEEKGKSFDKVLKEKRREKRILQEIRGDLTPEKLDALYKQAEEMTGIFNMLTERIARVTGAEGIHNPAHGSALKAKENAGRKIEIQFENQVEKLTDILRGSMVYDSVSKLENGLKTLIQAPEVSTVYINDRIDSPYVCDILVNIRLKNGHVAELQFQLREAAYCRETGYLLPETILPREAYRFTDEEHEIVDSLKKGNGRRPLDSRIDLPTFGQPLPLHQVYEIWRSIPDKKTLAQEALASKLNILMEAINIDAKARYTERTGEELAKAHRKI